MKKNLIIHFILVLLLKIGVTGCTEETISMNADRMPDETAMDNIAGALRNTTTLTNKAFIELTEGDESATEEIFYSLLQSAGSRLTVTAVVNEKLVEDYNEENNSKLNTLAGWECGVRKWRSSFNRCWRTKICQNQIYYIHSRTEY